MPMRNRPQPSSLSPVPAITAFPRRPSRKPKSPSLKQALLSLLFEKAFQYSDQPIFQLTSGRTSRYYIDCKKVTLDPYGAYLVGCLIFDRIKALKPQGIGGLTLGADPIAQAVSLISYLHRQPIPAFIIRKAPKDHGSSSAGHSLSGGWIEGNLRKGSRVIVVDDVVTTGGSTLKAIERLKAHGCCILKVLAVVDRHEGGTEAIAAQGLKLEPLLTIDDLLSLVPPKK